jgi:hypothetical protein
MKNIDELTDLLFVCAVYPTRVKLDIKSSEALVQAANKLTNIHNALFKIENSYGDLDQGVIDRVHAAGDRISKALDLILQRDISASAQKEIEAAKSECDSAIRALNKALRS